MVGTKSEQTKVCVFVLGYGPTHQFEKLEIHDEMSENKINTHLEVGFDANTKLTNRVPEVFSQRQSGKRRKTAQKLGRTNQPKSKRKRTKIGLPEQQFSSVRFSQSRQLKFRRVKILKMR